MSGPHVTVVFGATGAQGGSVIKALMTDKTCHVKAATRNPTSDKAKCLAQQGVEVIKVDMDDAASCNAALAGAHAVFLVTNYWEIFDEKREIQQGKNVADAAKANGVKHLVFSGLKSAKEHIHKDGAEHLESKKHIYDYICQLGLPCTTVDLAFYNENILSFMKPTKNDKNEYVMNIPMGNAPLDMICIEQCGACVHEILRRPDDYIGKWLALASSRKTIAEYAAVLSKVTGKTFIAGTVTPDQFAQLGFKGAGDLAVMFEYFANGYDHDVELTRKLNPAMPIFEQWAENNRAALCAAFP